MTAPPFADRRLVLQSLAGVIAMSQIPTPAVAAPAVPPGRPGDFDFLAGEWRIANRMLDKGKWIEFPGEATVVGILGGIASIEELRIPARNFSGMGLRLLDVERRVWSDFWVNARSGALSTPGQEGGFVDGVGTFTSTSEENGKTLIWRGVWDRITPTSCRWFQGGSRDGGQTWDDTWFMEWTRVR